MVGVDLATHVGRARSGQLIVTVRISRFASLGSPCRYCRQSSHQNVIYEAFPEWGLLLGKRLELQFSAQILAVLAIPCHSVGYNASPLGPQLLLWFI